MVLLKDRVVGSNMELTTFSIITNRGPTVVYSATVEATFDIYAREEFVIDCSQLRHNVQCSAHNDQLRNPQPFLRRTTQHFLFLLVAPVHRLDQFSRNIFSQRKRIVT